MTHVHDHFDGRRISIHRSSDMQLEKSVSFEPRVTLTRALDRARKLLVRCEAARGLGQVSCITTTSDARLALARALRAPGHQRWLKEVAGKAQSKAAAHCLMLRPKYLLYVLKLILISKATSWKTPNMGKNSQKVTYFRNQLQATNGLENPRLLAK